MNSYDEYSRKWFKDELSSHKWFEDNVDDSLLSEFIWIKISENASITWEIVEANPDRPWNYDALSSNPNIHQNPGY